jgi:hypothetical protein
VGRRRASARRGVFIACEPSVDRVGGKASAANSPSSQLSPG